MLSQKLPTRKDGAGRHPLTPRCPNLSTPLRPIRLAALEGIAKRRRTILPTFEVDESEDFVQPTENIAVASGDQSLSASEESLSTSQDSVSTGEDTDSEPDTSDAVALESSDVLQTATRCSVPVRGLCAADREHCYRKR